MSGVQWLVQHQEEGRVVFRIGCHGDELVADWPSLATLYATRDGRETRFVVADGANADVVAKIRQGAAEGLLAHARGGLALHAACFELDGVAIACMGESGSGKSTTVADACVRGGARFLSDDVLLVDVASGRALVSGREDSHWLTSDSVRWLRSTQQLEVRHPSTPSAKYRLSAGATPRPRLPLAAVVSLQFDDTGSVPSLRRLRGIEMMGRLLPSVVRFVLDDVSAQRREVENLARFTAHVKSFVLSRRRSMQQLDVVRDILFGLAGPDDAIHEATA